MRRRMGAEQSPVSYGSVGMTSSPDILSFPPRDFVSRRAQWKIGSGATRFDVSSEALFRWGMHRGAGVHIDDAGEGDTSGYVGVFRDVDGVWRFGADAPSVFLVPEGESIVVPGMRVLASGLWRWPSVTEHFRIIYVIREPRRVGFAWGSISERPVIGEEYFGLEWRDDDSVWSVVTSVVSLSDARLKFLRFVKALFFAPRHLLQLSRYVKALTPVRSGENVGRQRAVRFTRWTTRSSRTVSEPETVEAEMVDVVSDADERFV